MHAHVSHVPSAGTMSSFVPCVIKSRVFLHVFSIKKITFWVHGGHAIPHVSERRNDCNSDCETALCMTFDLSPFFNTVSHKLILSVHSRFPSFLCQFYTQCLFLLVFSCQLISLLFNRAASVFAAHLFSICGENLGVLTFDAGVRQDISLIAAWSDRCGTLHQKAWQFISSCLTELSKKDKISLDNLPEPFLHNPG